MGLWHVHCSRELYGSSHIVTGVQSRVSTHLAGAAFVVIGFSLLPRQVLKGCKLSPQNLVVLMQQRSGTRTAITKTDMEASRLVFVFVQNAKPKR